MSYVLDRLVVRARKPHQCEICRRQIPAGRRYFLDLLIGDGGPYTWKAHTRCGAMMELARDDIGYDGDGITAQDVCDWRHDLRHGLRGGAGAHRGLLPELRRRRRRLWAADTRGLHPYPWNDGNSEPKI